MVTGMTSVGTNRVINRVLEGPEVPVELVITVVFEGESIKATFMSP